VTKEEKLDYIFGDHPTQPIQNRFGWLNIALLGDIQTFINGIEVFLNDSTVKDPQGQGGGNLSIPILVCTGLELVSALYLGKTRYGSGYNATDNVQKFVDYFFPKHAKRIPRLLWDGVRNGIDHLFIPKSMQYSRTRVQFTFYVQDSSVPSNVTKSEDLILIKISSIEFYRTFKQAIDNYKIELEKDEELQSHFIDAWQSIENHVQDITTNQTASAEVDYLLRQLNQSNTLYLFNWDSVPMQQQTL
jgi:hypothetical protein